MYSENDDDHLFGEAGNDKLFGNFGLDLLDGGPGVNALDGGADTDTCLASTESTSVACEYDALGADNEDATELPKTDELAVVSVP